MTIHNKLIYEGGLKYVKVPYGEHQQWDLLNPGELIVGKRYDTGAPVTLHWTGKSVLEEDERLKDLYEPDEYYTFVSIENEFEQKILVDYRFFREYIN